MTEIEKKALALVNEVLVEWGVLKKAVEVPKNSDAFARALLRAIEHHEADKAAHAATVEGILNSHEAFRQDVSDALVEYFGPKDLNVILAGHLLERFVLPEPDPLVEAIREMALSDADQRDADRLRVALAKRGLKIVETGQ